MNLIPKRIIAAVFLFCFFSLSGCAKQSSQPNSSIDSSTYKESTTEDLHIDTEPIYKNGDFIQDKIDDNVTIKATVKIPDALQSLTMSKVKAHRPKLNKKQLKTIFFKGMKISSSDSYGPFKCREYGKYNIVDYTGENGAVLSCEPSNITYTDRNKDYYLNCLFTDPDFESYNLDHYSQTKEFSFASRQEVFLKIKSIFDSLDIPISEQYEAYSLDHKQLALEERPEDTDGNIIDSEKKENWTKKDNAYYFILHQEINGIPIEKVPYGDGYEGTGIEEMVLEVFWGEKGCLSFDEEWGYCLEPTKEEQNILSPGEAINCLEKKCDMLLIDQKWTIDTLSLKLLPIFIKDNDYEIRPVWFFEGSMEDEEHHERELVIMFDGITGKEIM